MQIVRNSAIDWEPLTLTLVGDRLQADDIERFTRQWLADRETAGICGCYEKSLSVCADGDRVVVNCEWMCERCLADFLRCLESQFASVREVRIGLERPKTAAVERSDESEFVPVVEKHVEMEDGRRVLVPAFRVSRAAVTTREFREFVDATSYETTAQLQGLADTYLDHPAMSPFAEERETGNVKCVSFYDCTAYCHWRQGVRLPTEYEWLAASIVDERVYDEWADRELINDAAGRLRQMSLPNALQSLGCEWTSTEVGSDMAVVRCGPQWVRFTAWKNDKNRRITPKDESSLTVGFRIVPLT
jgi:Sulfatase-modifying factor enzyme 1